MRSFREPIVSRRVLGYPASQHIKIRVLVGLRLVLVGFPRSILSVFDAEMNREVEENDLTRFSDNDREQVGVAAFDDPTLVRINKSLNLRTRFFNRSSLGRRGFLPCQRVKIEVSKTTIGAEPMGQRGLPRT